MIIPFIVSKGCEDCKAVKNQVVRLASFCGMDVIIEEVDFEEDEEAALDLAVKYELDDLPAFVINEVPFKGPKHSDEEILKALRKGKKQNGTRRKRI